MATPPQPSTEPLPVPQSGPQLQEQLERFRRKVDVDQFDLTIRELVRMASTDELRRAPVYQRKFRWDEERESTLVESIFLGLPVPSLFVATNPDGRWELVDGLQRVSTLMHYVADPLPMVEAVGKKEPLRLIGLEKLTAFNGKIFSELPEPIQLGFYKRALRVTALSDKSDPDVRFDMFERLNRGAVILTPQEVRACIHQGRFNDFLRELSGMDQFKRLVKLERSQSDDGTKEEIVLKFFAYLYDRDRFDGAVTKFLNNYMKNAAQTFPYDEGRSVFIKSIDQILEINGGPILRKGTAVTPINQLEGILVGAAEVIRNNGSLQNPGPNWLEDEQLVRMSTAGTNTRAKLNGRIDRAKGLLSGRVGPTQPQQANRKTNRTTTQRAKRSKRKGK